MNTPQVEIPNKHRVHSKLVPEYSAPNEDKLANQASPCTME